MALTIDRRSLILGAGLGLTALTLFPQSGLAQMMTARGFTHGVASGEPGPDSMLLWTRYVAGGDATLTLQAEVASDAAFAHVVAGGSIRTGPYRDWTAKITIDGLKPGTVYWYRFVAPDGSTSPVGRIKTLPVGDAPRFRMAVFSCSNLPVGWFNAYAHAAARNDIDLLLHVGDYFYESGATDIPERRIDPNHEIITLADYRLRYACYRSDPDLQRLHAVAPMIVQWDDHEAANDDWEGGAQAHGPEDGDWNARRAAAIQAYREWMPVSDEPWKAYPIGTLATLYRTESRLLARTQQLDVKPLFTAANPESAIKAFRDGAWMDPSATMLGSTQESWLAHAFRANAKSGGWQIVGMGTIIGRTLTPAAQIDWLKSTATPASIETTRQTIMAAKLGLPVATDRWDGYPAARARLLKSAQAADADLVMLSGDSHNAWAYALQQDGRPAGVEFAGQGVTSNGMESNLGADPKMVAREYVAANPELKWCDTSRRGYMTIDITPRRVTGEWSLLNTVKARDISLAGTHAMAVDKGRRVFNA